MLFNIGVNSVESFFSPAVGTSFWGTCSYFAVMQLEFNGVASVKCSVRSFIAADN